MRRIIIGTLAAAVVAIAATSATAQDVDVLIGGGPGGGWDTTARQSLAAMTEAGIVDGAVNFENKGGAAGTVALADFMSRYEGNDDGLMFMGAVMVGGIALNKSPVDLEETTPLARLTNENLAVVVAADSPFKTIDDFAAALKADPGSVPVGGGSAGGPDHILLALIAKDQGADVGKINYIAQTSGAETAASVIGGSVKAGISGISEFKSFIEAGRLRALAVSGEEPVEGVDAPTLQAAGIDVTLGNWRGVLGAPGMSAEARQAWVERLDKLHESEAWKTVLETQGWEDAYMSGDQFAAFLKDESTRMTGVLKDVGLVE